MVDAGGVDEDVGLQVAVGQLDAEPVDLVPAAQVGRDRRSRETLGGQLLGGGTEPGFVSRDQHDGSSGTGQRCRDRRPDAATGTGDDGRAVAEGEQVVEVAHASRA